MAIIVLATVGIFLGYRSGGFQTQQPQTNVNQPQTYVNLDVSSSISESTWNRDSSTNLPIYSSKISYQIKNNGNTASSSIQITIKVDGITKYQSSTTSLSPSQTYSGSFSLVTTYDDKDTVIVIANSTNSNDYSSSVVDAKLPRYMPLSVSKLYVTPYDSIINQTYNEIESNRLFITPRWMAIRDWVASNIKYETDSGGDYWKLPRETIRDKKGDCEDYAILLCSLLRRAGYTTDRVYVIGGYQGSNGHAWVKCNLDIIGWRYFEPQANGLLEMIVADLFTLNDYQEAWEFNDASSYKMKG